jgi:predicted ATP-grasp superfamily ATP-dependent carboligase
LLVQRHHADAHVIACGGLFVSNELVALITTRWHRRWPPPDGATSFCETIAPPPQLLAKVAALLAALRYEGIFELELLDLGDGEFSAIALNPRPFGWLALAVRAGTNLPALWCDCLLQKRPAPVRARPGVFYRWDDGDARHLVWQLVRGNVRAAARVLKPRRRVAHAYFELRDPAPLAAALAFLVVGRLRRYASRGLPLTKRR